MKAVLIFNIEGTTIDDLRLYAIPLIESVSGKEIKATSDLVLRLLPQKMTMEKALKMERCGSIKDIYTTWDACLAEITGENE